MLEFPKAPDGASKDWISELELNVVDHKDDHGRIVKRSPVRRFISAGDPVVVFKIEKGRFYWEGGGEPIPEWEIASRFKHIPVDQEALQKSLEEKALKEKKPEEVKIEDPKKETVVYVEDLEKEEQFLADMDDSIVPDPSPIGDIPPVTTIDPPRRPGRPPKRDK